MDPRATFDESRLGELNAIKAEIATAQMAQIAHHRRVIILLEGPEGAGKKFALKRLCSAFDACHIAVHCVGPDRRRAADGHWLARYWRSLPAAGSTAIFYRSWYRRVLDERLDGKIEGKALARAFDEINEFEAQQRDHGTLIVKLYFDVSPPVQKHRLEERLRDPWRRTVEFAASLRTDHPDYREAFDGLIEGSSMRWSQWHVIKSDDPEQATLDAMSRVLTALREAMPADPPEVLPPITHFA